MHAPQALLFILTLLLFGGFCHAAIVEGEIYDGITLQTIKQAHITFGTEPPRLITTQEGRYSIELAPGTYTIYAEQNEQGNPIKITREKITIPSNGRYTHDLVLLPPLHSTIAQSLPAESEIAPDIFSNLEQPLTILFVIGIVLLGIEAAIIITRKNKAPVTEPPYQIMEINNSLPLLKEEKKRKPTRKKIRQTKITS